MKTSIAIPCALLLALCLLTAGCSPAPQSASVRDGAKAEITLTYLDSSKQAYRPVSQKGRGMVRLTVDGPMRGPGIIFFSGTRYMVVQLDKEMPETLAYSPTGEWIYKLPAETGQKDSIWRVLPPQAFSGDKHLITARAATPREVAAYRNVALNPYDVRTPNFSVESIAYPHATSNSECRGEADFAARNAIDGHTENTRHGPWPVQSWGPDQRTDLWWQVDFGRPVEVDKVVLYIRADFPHDAYWHDAMIEFSDGSKVKISLERKAAAQEFTFPKRVTNYVKFTDLEQTKPLGWAGFTEVEVWGRDITSVQTK